MKLTAMQIAEAKKCKSPEEVVEKAKAHGIEMTLEEAKEALAAPAIIELDDDDLAAVSGGGSCNDDKPATSVTCKKCGQTANYACQNGTGVHYYDCSTCGYTTVYKNGVYEKLLWRHDDDD